MTGSIHWPTAVLVAGTMLLLWLAVALLRRSRRRGLPLGVDRATYNTLHTASLASQHLGEGLTPEAAERAGRHLLSILGAHAVSVSDPGRGAVVDRGRASTTARPRTPSARRPASPGAPSSTAPTSSRAASPTAPCAARSPPPSSWTTSSSAPSPRGPSTPRPGSPGPPRRSPSWVASQLALAELARTRTRVMEAELRALRAQISPHFIYNSLAAIASFVRTDPDRARELLIDFADFTRYALRTGGPVHDPRRGAAQRRALPRPRAGPLRRPAPDLPPHRARGAARDAALPRRAAVGGERRPARARRQGGRRAPDDHRERPRVRRRDQHRGRRRRHRPGPGAADPRRRPRERLGRASATSTPGCARSTATSSASSSRPPSGPARGCRFRVPKFAPGIHAGS